MFLIDYESDWEFDVCTQKEPIQMGTTAMSVAMQCVPAKQRKQIL